MKIGDRVFWQSQSRGSTKTKVGVIVKVVPAHQHPSHIIKTDSELFYLNMPGAGFGSSRPMESYLVKVGIQLYWPRVAHLKSPE